MLDPKRILVVDDEEDICRLMSRLLSSWGYDAVKASSGTEALALLDESVSLVLLDVNMPGLSGLDVLTAIRGRHGAEKIPVIIMTAEPTPQARMIASEFGASDFIVKPFDQAEVHVRVRGALALKASQELVEQRQAELEELVAQRTAALEQALQESLKAQRRLQQAHLESLHRLALAAEYKDELTGNHIQRVGRISVLLGQAVGLPHDELKLLGDASALHDVGKIGIPDAVLHKPGRLTADERAIMQRHTTIGARILGSSTADVVQMASTIALTHHEWWNVGGYPHGLQGEAIPMPGRICAVADVFDALTSRRPYKEPWSNERAISLIRESSGQQFDPVLVEQFIASLDRVVEIQGALRDGHSPDTVEQIRALRRVPLADAVFAPGSASVPA